jgi:hypothetical protein
MRALRVFGVSIRIGLGLTLAIFGLIGVVFGIGALIDPVGAKMADSADPFGTPLSVPETLVLMAIYATLMVLGWWIAVFPHKRKEHDT